MIKAIVFDLGGVLIENPASKMFSFYAKILGVSKEEFERVFKKYEDLWQKGKIKEAELWLSLSKDLNLSDIIFEDKSYWLEGFKEAYKENENMFNLALNLKNNKYKTVLLSNTEIPVMSFIKNRKYKSFNYFIYSCAIGMTKPNPEIFKFALNEIGEKAKNVIFIDDKLENIQAAIKLGIEGIVFRNYKDLKKELKKSKII